MGNFAFPVYTVKLDVYPFVESAKMNSLNPHLVDVSFMYCVIPVLAFVATILSSIARFFLAGKRTCMLS